MHEKEESKLCVVIPHAVRRPRLRGADGLNLARGRAPVASLLCALNGAVPGGRASAVAWRPPGHGHAA